LKNQRSSDTKNITHEKYCIKDRAKF